MWFIRLLEEPVPEPLLFATDFSCMFLFLYISAPDCNAYCMCQSLFRPPLQSSKQLEYVQSSAPRPPPHPWACEKMNMCCYLQGAIDHMHTHAAGDATCRNACSQTITTFGWVLGKSLYLSLYNTTVYKTIYNYYSDTIKSTCNTLLILPNMCQSNHIQKHKLILFQFIWTKHSIQINWNVLNW